MGKINKNIAIVPSQFIYSKRDDRYKAGFKIVNITTISIVDQVIPEIEYGSDNNDWFIQLYSLNNGYIDKLYGVKDWGYYKEYEQPLNYIRNFEDMNHTIDITYKSRLRVDESVWISYCNEYRNNNLTENNSYEFFREFIFK